MQRQVTLNMAGICGPGVACGHHWSCSHPYPYEHGAGTSSIRR